MRVRKTRALACLWICFALFAGSVFVEFAAATTSDLLAEVNELTVKIQNTPDDCWAKPSCNRKATMINKLNALRALVEEENLEEAYDKLLFDIKLKLTGLKTDENEEPWSADWFKNPWVVCEALREELRIDCNELLSHVCEEPEPPVDDDTEPPVVWIDYVGEETTENPGVWNVVVEDVGSGLDEVIIKLDGNVIIHDSNLGGIASKTYNNIAVPGDVGVHTIEVYGRDYDIDWVGDQQEITISQDVMIQLEPPPVIIDG